MVIHAYSEEYLTSAQRILGDMLDYASDSYEMDLDEFFSMFLVSDVAFQFQTGNPAYVAGKTGCELVREVIRKSGLVMPELPDKMYLDKSPEYWTGWALAYYQWYTGRTFKRIHRAVPIGEMIRLYPVFHEMDIMQLVSVMDRKLEEFYTETNLKRIRKNSGLSQSELAELSGISLKQIQLFEQRQRDINHTKAINIVRLGRVLGCPGEELLEL